MSDLSTSTLSITRPGRTEVAQAFGATRRGDTTAVSAPASAFGRGDDLVEISPIATRRFLDQLTSASSEPIRRGVVGRVREEIDLDSYLSDEKIDLAIDALLASGDLD